MSHIMIEYAGTAGGVLSVPALRRSYVVDAETGERTPASGDRIGAGELRLVAEDVGLQLLAQGHYVARCYAEVVVLEGTAIADGKSRVQVKVHTRDEDGRLKVAPSGRTMEVAIVAAGGQVAKGGAFAVVAGQYSTFVTAKAAGVVVITGTVDGTPFVPVRVEFHAAPEAKEPEASRTDADGAAGATPGTAT